MRISKRTSKLLVKIARENNVRASVVNQIIDVVLKDKYYQYAYEVDQTLGIALGYPYYANDQKNFPGATEADGVCTGEHVPESIASEAARRINDMFMALNAVLQHIAICQALGDRLDPEAIRTTIHQRLGDYSGPSKVKP